MASKKELEERISILETELFSYTKKRPYGLFVTRRVPTTASTINAILEHLNIDIQVKEMRVVAAKRKKK